MQPDDLHVFGNNSGSMSFSGDKEDNYIFYYDANVVGDACPSTTIYLVIDENELPDEISTFDSEDNLVRISKEDIIKIKNIFVNEVFNNYYNNTWAFEELNKLSRDGNKIVDIKITNYLTK